MKSSIPTAVVALGVLLLISSFLWAILFPASRTWTDEKSAQMTSLGDQATEIRLKLDLAKSKPSMHSGENPAELQAKYDEVAAQYKELYEEFNGASKAPESASRLLRWSGIAFVAAGGFITFATRSG